jgi:hypothetical protein
MQLMGLAVMAAADIVSGARSGLLGAIISAWPAVAFFAVLGQVIAQRIDELAGHLAGDDPPGEGYLAKVARLSAVRDHAQERVLGEYLLLPPPDEDRPVVVDRGHPSWAEVDAEQREWLGDPPGEEGRS